jgi:hypothetical protein
MQELVGRDAYVVDGARAASLPVSVWEALCRVPLSDWLVILAVELYATLWSLFG